MNDPKKLDELEALEKKATPGEWHRGGIFNPGSGLESQNIWGPIPPKSQSGVLVAQHARIPDAKWISALHNAAPELLKAAREAAEKEASFQDTIRRLRGELNEAIEKRDSLEDVAAEKDAKIARLERIEEAARLLVYSISEMRAEDFHQGRIKRADAALKAYSKATEGK